MITEEKVTDLKNLCRILMCAVIVCVLLAGCGKTNDTALVISGTEINQEIYSYFYDKVTARPNDYGLPENPQKSDVGKAVTKLCTRYVAANTSFASRGLALPPADKVSISEQVNNLWIRSKEHYRSIGVSKQTLTKIITAQTYESAIFSSIYDKGVDNEADERAVRDYFYSNYMAFRCVCAYFTSPDGAELSQQEKNNLLEKMDQISELSSGTSETFSEICSNYGFAASGTVILKKGAEGYPEGFYERVYSQSAGTAVRYTYDECVFVVWKEDIRELGDSLYAGYRSECIEEMYADEWEERIASYLTNFKVEK